MVLNQHVCLGGLFFLHRIEDVAQILVILPQQGLLTGEKPIKISVDVIINGSNDGFVHGIAGYICKGQMKPIVRPDKIIPARSPLIQVPPEVCVLPPIPRSADSRVRSP